MLALPRHVGTEASSLSLLFLARTATRPVSNPSIRRRHGIPRSRCASSSVVARAFCCLCTLPAHEKFPPTVDSRLRYHELIIISTCCAYCAYCKYTTHVGFSRFSPEALIRKLSAVSALYSFIEASKPDFLRSFNASGPPDFNPPTMYSESRYRKTATSRIHGLLRSCDLPSNSLFIYRVFSKCYCYTFGYAATIITRHPRRLF